MPGPAADSTHCLNCGEQLRGQYCARCGQRAGSRRISVWELTKDAFGDLFELDSRLWRTLTPLMLRPGRLTHDYLQGRRARYMPPFRMYLVLSLLFFVFALFDPRQSFPILFVPEETPQSAPAAVNERVGAVLEELEAEGIVENRVATGQVFASCEIDATELADLPRWLQTRLTPDRIGAICQRINEAGGNGFMRSVMENIPTALIVLLPLLALVLKSFYPFSRRYYVEHLLFLVHFHSFWFLLLSLQVLISRLSFLNDAIATGLVTAASLYVPVYLFLAMRTVYAQSRWATSIKFVALGIAYSVSFATMMLLVFAVTAMRI